MGITLAGRSSPDRAWMSFTVVASTSSLIDVTWDEKNEWMNSVGTATMRPNAVQFSASAMPEARNAERCAGSAWPTALKEKMRPDTVPKSPSSVEALASMARYRMRLDNGGSATEAAESA